jgi:hypothetical protein
MIINKLFEKNSKGWSFADYVKVVTYLVKYGYLFHQYKNEVLKDGELSPAELLSLVDAVDAGIDRLRNFLQVNDLDILKVVDLPRCSVPDFQVEAASQRKWGKKNLSYFIEKRDTDLSAELWDATIAKAFASWSEVADLKFNRVNSSNANIIVSIGRGRSSDFDGPNGTLAWAQLPGSSNYTGQLLTKADADEKWITSGSNGIKLENVMCHELGHILGLEHSSRRTALMAPIYSINVAKPQSNDDISRIVNLYGKPTGSEPRPTPNPTPTPELDPTPNSLEIKVNGQITSISIAGYRVTKLDN